MELDDCQKKVVFLEEQLRVAQRQTDRAMLLKLKKVRTGEGGGKSSRLSIVCIYSKQTKYFILHVVLCMCFPLFQQVQEREVELSSAREELSSALEQVELLTSQLDEIRSRADPANINAQLKLVRKTPLILISIPVVDFPP